MFTDRARWFREAIKILQVELVAHVIVLSKRSDKTIYAECRIIPSKRRRRVRYGPEFLRLIESPDFRAHFDLGAGPIATKRAQAVRCIEHDLGGHGIDGLA